MDSRKLTNEISVAPQISVADVDAIAAAGFRSIICNRPDGEDFGQPECHEIEQRAREVGLEFAWQPIVGGQLGPQQVSEFGDLYDRLPKPVLAYCRSGTRCTTVWAFSQAGRLDTSEIIAAAAAAGYDLSGFAGALEHFGAQKTT